MAYDFKKEYKDLYLPKAKPSLIEVPAMNFVAVAGTGDPNQNGGFYQQALELFEIYLSDPRRTKPENLKTVIRHPIV